MDLTSLRRAVGARLGYCFRQDPKDTMFVWHVRLPNKQIRSYTSDVMDDIPKWTWFTDDALRLCEVARENGLHISMHHHPDGRWGAEAWHKPADSDSMAMLDNSQADGDTLAEAICAVFCLIMPEVGQE